MPVETPDRQAYLDRTFREAEQAGLRIAIKGRLVALVLLGAYLVVSRIANPEHALELGLGIAGFAALGLIHYPLIGSRHDRVWLKYAFITLDIAVLSLLMATQPIFDTVDVPQAMSFRNTVFPFYFVILGVAAFSFSPGLVLWSGIMGAAGWLGAFAWAVRDMPVRFDWSDIGTSPTTEHFLSIFLSPDFIGTGSRIQESVAYLVVAALIAAVMWRARRTVRRQLELDEEQRALTDVGELGFEVLAYHHALFGVAPAGLMIGMAANEGVVPSTFKDPLSDEDVDIRVLLRADQRTSVAG